MTNWRESATVVIYRCESCGSLHGRGKSEIIPRTWSDDHAWSPPHERSAGAETCPALPEVWRCRGH